MSSDNYEDANHNQSDAVSFTKQEEGATRSCPYCGETILSVARKCRFCKSMLNEEGGGQKTNSRQKSLSDFWNLESNCRALGRLVCFGGIFVVTLFVTVCVCSSNDDGQGSNYARDNSAQESIARKKAIEERKRRAEEEQRLRDEAFRAANAQKIHEVEVAKELTTELNKCHFATTSLAKDSAWESYKRMVKSRQGSRAIFQGNVTEVGDRILSFSQKYLTLKVVIAEDQKATYSRSIKYIFEERDKDMLLKLNAGESLAIGGTIVSSGDLNHCLTLKDPEIIDHSLYSDLKRVSKK